MSKQLLLVRPDECWSPLVSEPLSEARAIELAGVFKAIGDSVRLRLLSMIASTRVAKRVSVT